MSTTIGTNYRQKNNLHINAHNLHFCKQSNVSHTVKAAFTFLMLSSLCFKQSVKRTFLTPFFSSFFTTLCRLKTSFRVSVILKRGCDSTKTAGGLLTCLLDRSVRSILLRTSRCGLTSRVSWNTGFLPEKGMCSMLKKNQTSFYLCGKQQHGGINLPGLPKAKTTCWASFWTFLLVDSAMQCVCFLYATILPGYRCAGCPCCPVGNQASN